MRLRRSKAFTLIELIMVIMVLGILSAVATARFFDLSNSANSAAEKGVVAGVSAGLYTYFMQNKTFPDSLDSAGEGQACNPANPCFTNILGQGGITEGWFKGSSTSYSGPTGRIYIYDKLVGSFN
jgi:general secretion pathway protein G